MRQMPPGEDIIQKGKFKAHASTEIDFAFSLLVKCILFTLLCAWSHVPDREQHQNKPDHSLQGQKRSARVLCSCKWLL